MKLKGIPVIEQHVEKIVVGVVGAVFVGVLGMQFAFQPNQVKVGNNAPLPPDRVLEPVVEEARRVEAMVATESPRMPEMNRAPMLDGFRQSLAQGVAPAPRIAALGRGLPFGERIDVGSGDARFADISIPAPGAPVAASFWTTIDPLEVALVPEIATVLPSQQPFDKGVVSVQTTFSGEALRQALDTDPDGDGPLQPVRRAWREEMEILAVRLQRQEQALDGTWSEPVDVAPMPGRPNMVSDYIEIVDSPATVGDGLAEARALHEEIVRPAFYRTMSGAPEWVEPMAAKSGEGEGAAAGSSSKDIDRKVRRIRDLRRELEQLRRQSEQDQQRRADPGDPRQPGSEGGRGRSGGGSSGGGQRDSDRNREATQEERRRQQFEARLQAREDELERLTDELEKAGFGPDGKALSGAARPDAAASSAAESDFKPLLEDPAVKLIAHDVAANPGRVLRYRAQVVVNNPFFGQGPSLKPDQQSLAESPVIAGAWSEWSAPVELPAAEYFFVTNATGADQIRGPRATVELFKFYYGYPRRAVLSSAEPGDLLMDEAKLPPDLVIFDLEKLKNLNPEDAQNPGAPAPGDAPRDSRDPRDSRSPRDGRRGEPGTEGDVRRGQPGDAGTPGAGEAGATNEALKELGTPAPSTISVGLDAVLLDVVPAPAGSASGARSMLVYLRDPQGRIVVRDPAGDRTSELYKRLAAAAELGARQGAPAPAPVEPERPRPTLPPRERPEPRAPRGNPGGGGGGGG
ncbi:MAG: hypothetical protein SFZ23_13955 [Planctomycetota bacterium]|nr:hypothetical protein [Planctomycetota bacterium]